MPRFTEEPAVTEKEFGGDNNLVSTHPAFAQIAVSRVSGEESLYGSDFISRNFITIRISRSEMHRSLGRDWHHEREEIIEVGLTESQWATFVSSPNMGSGVPCTIQRLNGLVVPGLPDPQAKAEQFKQEFDSKMEKIVARIDDLIAGAKSKKEKMDLELLKQEIVSNVPFVAKQFGRHVEKTVESARQEIHGYMTNLLINAGLNALEAQRPLELGHDTASEQDDE